ncbi:MAG: SAM-dependent methyltransferase [SAR86 cluster bacterium]|uniref:SAM-dependent methyltransferase n=1 Tax=SAR86 cluster bacterium TaxID=2030880 RepID=A0A2A4WWX1_9GAMM|nr:MAG: SAM-dependent methyltransferase [SAR86 cluster bacterium]
MRAVDFWDKRAESYAKSPVGDEAAYKEKLETTQRYFNAESQVMEFGCGTGTTAIHHAPFVQKIVATDISSNMIRIARNKAEAANITNIEFQCSTLEDFEATNASFDVVMAHNILHLLEDPEQAIRISYRLLKPGGVFVTSTGCLGDSFSHWRVLLIIMKILRKAPYVNVMKRVTLENYFRNAGFEVDLEWNRKKQAAFIILKKPAEK